MTWKSRGLFNHLLAGTEINEFPPFSLSFCPRNANPVKLAERFCRVYGLPAEKVAKLSRYIEENMLALTLGQDEEAGEDQEEEQEETETSSVFGNEDIFGSDLSLESEVSSSDASDSEIAPNTNADKVEEERWEENLVSSEQDEPEKSFVWEEVARIEGHFRRKPSPRKQAWMEKSDHPLDEKENLGSLEPSNESLQVVPDPGKMLRAALEEDMVCAKFFCATDALLDFLAAIFRKVKSSSSGKSYRKSPK